jgi:hypothetical protein
MDESNAEWTRDATEALRIRFLEKGEVWAQNTGNKLINNLE